MELNHVKYLGVSDGYWHISGIGYAEVSGKAMPYLKFRHYSFPNRGADIGVTVGDSDFKLYIRAGYWGKPEDHDWRVI